MQYVILETVAPQITAFVRGKEKENRFCIDFLELEETLKINRHTHTKRRLLSRQFGTNDICHHGPGVTLLHVFRPSA